MGKNNVFKRIPTFAAGMLAMAMLAALAEPVSAAGEKIAYNQVGIRVMREQQVKAGETCTAPNGRQVPSTITYTDAAGSRINYLAVPQLAELLDADISWDEENGNVEIGVSPVPGNITVTVGTGSRDDPPTPTPPNEPEYGLTIGNLEEIDPETVKDVLAANPSGYYTRDVRMQSPNGSFPEITAHPSSGSGSYLVYTVTNNGETPKAVTVMRPVSIANRRESFPTLHVQPGETLTRVFRVLPDEDTHPMQRTFSFGVGRSVTDRDIHPRDLPLSDVTISLVEYQG